MTMCYAKTLHPHGSCQKVMKEGMLFSCKVHAFLNSLRLCVRATTPDSLFAPCLSRTSNMESKDPQAWSVWTLWDTAFLNHQFTRPVLLTHVRQSLRRPRVQGTGAPHEGPAWAAEVQVTVACHPGMSDNVQASASRLPDTPEVERNSTKAVSLAS